MLAAYRGDEAGAVPLIETSREEATANGQGRALSMIDCSSAILFNGLARYEEATAAAESAAAHEGMGLYALALPELIEAAVRSGRDQLGSETLERLVERTQASGTDWALGLETRSRALLAAGLGAEAFYQDAIARLSRGHVALHLARAKLVYGEWLRRENRRVDARQQLSSAFAVRPVRCTGVPPSGPVASCRPPARQRADAPRSQPSLLTPQEAQIARLARDGLTNSEIGARLFISPRTVEYHLHKVFPKLDIISRKELPPRVRLGSPAVRPGSTTGAINELERPTPMPQWL